MVDELNQSKNFFDDDDISLEDPSEIVVSERVNDFNSRYLPNLVKYIVASTWVNRTIPETRATLIPEWQYLYFPIYKNEYTGADLRVLYLSVFPTMFIQPNYKIDVLCDYNKERKHLKVTLAWLTHTTDDEWYKNITSPGSVWEANKFHSLTSQKINPPTNYTYRYFEYTDSILGLIVTNIVRDLAENDKIYLTSADVDIEFLINGTHFFTYNKFLNTYWKYIKSITNKNENDHRCDEIDRYMYMGMPDFNAIDEYIRVVADNTQFREKYKTLKDLHITNIGFVSGMRINVTDINGIQMQQDAMTIIANKYHNSNQC